MDIVPGKARALDVVTAGGTEAFSAGLMSVRPQKNWKN